MISTHVTNRGPRPLIQSMIKSEGGYKGISGGVRYLSYLLNFFTNRIWLPQVAILASVVLTIINYPQLVLIERNDAEISETNVSNKGIWESFDSDRQLDVDGHLYVHACWGNGNDTYIYMGHFQMKQCLTHLIHCRND